MFDYQNFEQNELSIPGLSLRPYESDHTISKFDITLSAMESAEQVYFSFQYCSALFKAETIERFIAYFKKIVSVVVKEPSIKLSAIDILSEQERNQLLFEFNDTTVDYPREKTVIDLFEEQVEKTPDNIALVFEGESLSYRDFNNRVNHLAKELETKGISQSDIVGIMSERSLEMMVGIYGILKVGAAYLPIDVYYPQERIAYVLKDSGAQLLLTTISTLEIGYLDISTHTIEQGESERSVACYFKSKALPKGLAYVIYTSGSTGNPKGVMIEHGSLINYISWAGDYYLKGENSVFPFYSSITFDLTVTSIFTPLITGYSIIIYGETKDNITIEEVTEDKRCNIIKLTPSH
jgi:tyrocidine synthetase-3